MKIDDMDAFVAVIRCQSTKLAADVLQLTQPAVTRRLQNFEEDLGANLLDRNTKPLTPTLMGWRVYEQCKLIRREIDSLHDLVANDTTPSGSLRLGVPQTIGDVVLLEALQQIRATFPELQTKVVNGWGGNLLTRMENREIDAAAVLFPAGKIFPDGISGRSIGRMPLLVVAAKDTMSKRNCRLKDCYEKGWVLNPDGCGFRAGLLRSLTEQGLSLQVNMETFGTELQLGLVASGMGLGLVPEPLFTNSLHRERLDAVNVTDFKPIIDLWLVHPRHIGNLSGAVNLFADVAAKALGPTAQ